MYQDSFGFLTKNVELIFSGGIIRPAADFTTTLAFLTRCADQEGYIHPQVLVPAGSNVLQPEIREEVRLPLSYSEHFRLPPSHTLTLEIEGTPENLRKRDAGFIVHLLGYIYGARLHFHDWWIDLRVPITNKARWGGIVIAPNSASDFLTQAYCAWKSWRTEEKERIINILYMHSRVPAYHRDWEQFTIAYMVLDGLWKTAVELTQKGKNNQNVPHYKRIESLCTRFEIPCDEKWIRLFCSLRSNLFHETIWDGRYPGDASSGDAFMGVRHLHRLNQRLIPAILGYENDFVKSSWWSLSPTLFDNNITPKTTILKNDH